MSEPYTVIIPARLQSTRLPNKVLLPIADKPMLHHVINRAQESQAKRIVVTSNDDAVLALAKSLGVESVKTHDEHKTGTDRIAEADEKLRLRPDEVIVGLQADEPMLPGKLIDQVAQTLASQHVASVATLCMPLENMEVLSNANVVKVVRDQDDFALYFSRAMVPHPRESMKNRSEVEAVNAFYRHIGLYAYRAGFLKLFASWPGAIIEKIEQLEQLRILWHGQKILVKEAVEHPGYGVDTLEDLNQVLAIMPR